MKGFLRSVLVVLLAVASVAAWQPVHAQPYPNKPVRLVIPYPPGGGTDTIMRPFVQYLSERLGQQIIIDNRGGGGGSMGMEAVARATPDGYTLVAGLTAQLAVNPALYKKLPYDPVKDYAPISLFADGPYLLVVHPSLPVKSLKDLVELARKSPNKINYASSGNGSGGHLAAEMLMYMAGIKMLHIPYKGGGPAIIDVVAGQVPVTFGTAASVTPHTKTGRLRALGVTGGQRSALLPELPTIAESGLKGYEMLNWLGMFAPAGTPPAIVNQLYEHIARALALKDVRERIDALGGEIVASNPRDTEKFLGAQIAKWAKVVKQGNIKVE